MSADDDFVRSRGLEEKILINILKCFKCCDIINLFK